MMDKHSKTLEELMHKPHLIGIDWVDWVAKEPQCFYGLNNSLLVEPDLLFRSSSYVRPFFVVEYKASNRRELKAVEQLLRAEQFVYCKFGQECYKLFVTPKAKGFNIKYFDGKPRKRCGK